LIAAGEVTWVGFDAIGERDGAGWLVPGGEVGGHCGRWHREQASATPTGNRVQKERRWSESRAVVAYLKVHGASFFQQVHDGVGGGYPGETLDAIWGLVWRGLLTNDALQALRAYCAPAVVKTCEAGA